MTLALTGSSMDRYSYGPDNLRVWKLRPDGVDEIYYYDALGQRLGTYTFFNFQSTQSAMTQASLELYFAGRKVKSWGLQYGQSVPRDRLGSIGPALYPYGEEYATTAQNLDKFATYYRDGTTALDYAKNRYYSSTLGGFMSADQYRSNALIDPGQWNKYAYVGNDPIKFDDPTGLFRQCPPEMHTDSTGMGCEPDGVNFEYLISSPGLLFWLGLGGAAGGGGGGGGGGIGSVPVNKSYNIDVRCHESAATLTNHLKNSFASFANFTGTLAGLTTTLTFNVPSGGISTGVVLQIPHATLGLTTTDSVTVTQANATSFTFTTNPGHPLADTTISFTAQDMGSGFVGFAININGQTANGLFSLFFKAGGSDFENGVWNHVLGKASRRSC